MQKDDLVLVVDENHEYHGEILTVENPDGNILYREHIGDHIIVKDGKGKTNVLRNDQYALCDKNLNRLKEFKRIVFDNVQEVNPSPIKTHDIITPKERDNGTRKLFYPVVFVTDYGVSFYDDLDNKRSYPFDKVEKVDNGSLLNYIVDLQNQVHELRQLVVQSLELTTDDIQRKLDEFKG